MDSKNDLNSFHPQISPKTPIPLFSPGNTVALYTVVSILFAMKDHLGLEAMLEYMARYLSLIEKNNPRIKSAVKQALAVMSVEKIYKDAMARDEE